MMTEEVYRPKCIVKYSRLAFTVPTNDIRITLDSGVSAQEGQFNLFQDSCHITRSRNRDGLHWK